jgi:large subunit ribosomal protein L24
MADLKTDSRKFMAGKFKVRKNDQVLILSGRDRGRRGRVIEVIRTKGKVLVEGINIMKKHERPNRARGLAGGVVERESPIDISNVMVIEGGKPTRIGYEQSSDGRKVRVSKKTGAVLE